MILRAVKKFSFFSGWVSVACGAAGSSSTGGSSLQEREASELKTSSTTAKRMATLRQAARSPPICSTSTAVMDMTSTEATTAKMYR